MTTANTQRRVLILGKSQLVLDDAVASLREIGYAAQATNDFFSDITGRFDVKAIDLVMFGGAVPPDRKAQLKQEMGAINPGVMFADGLAGIPGLIVNQIQGAFAPDHQDSARAPTYTPEDRIIRLTLAGPHDVKVTAWWTASVVPPNPSRDSLVLLDDRLAGGDYPIPIPDYVPAKSVFATVQVDTAIYAFSVAAEQ
jgi:hypothetical protein